MRRSWIYRIKGSLSRKREPDALPPFFMSSIPKSGTHLLHQILTGIPHVSMDIANSEKKFFFDVVDASGEFYRNLYRDHFERLSSLSENEFGLGHVRCTEEYVRMLRQLDIKHVFVHRDPRDVLVSMSYFIKDGWGGHPLQEDFQSTYVTPAERQLVLIEGAPGQWPDFRTYTSSFYKWLDDEKTHHVSFESLVGSESSRREALFELARFLWEGLTPPISLEEMVSKMVANIDPGSSYTFRSGNTRSWSQEFDRELKEAFKNNAGDLLIRFGYESDNEW